jgi:TolB-like protein/Flp pilus assembly protein TadD
MGTASTTVCSVCGEPLGPKRTCFPCLLRAGLDESEQPGAPEAAAVFDDFEIARRDDGSLWELGRGAMGVTYRATEKPLHRSVALKVIELHGSEAVRERFLREARAAAALRHPNVAGVFRFGAMDETDRCYCAMELVEGETLDALVRRDGPLKLETALGIAIQIARALIAAAERQLVHRDLKPGNIMLTPSENSPAKIEVKVIDFGLAKAVSAAGEMELTHGEFVGTPAFASPEQFAGGSIDARTDIYALGVTLWFALTGRLPFAGRTIEEIRQRQSEDKLPLEQLEGVPRRVLELIRSCLAINLEERPSSAQVLLKALEACKAESVTRRRKVKLAVLAVFGALVLGVAAWLLLSKRNDVAVPPVVPEKSIAVLPFENLSDDKANAYFADGIQDEILTRLSRIGDLKVISRTSTQNYKSAPRNLAEIGRQLGVSAILEGSVQKDGDKVRINVQLIRASSDSHLWAETFDRKLTDIFSVESEVAKAIADRLQARLTGEEQQFIAAKPTDNPEAYDAYLRGLAYSLKTANTTANALGAQKYLREAVRLDPRFALAWALLSYVEARAYRTEFLPPTEALREEAREAAETALTLRPNLGEAVLAKGFYHYACLRDYETAVRYFEQARPLLPNSSRIPESLAYVSRKQGQWDRSESYFNEAERLDPRNVSLLTQHALSYKDRRHFPEALRKLEQILNITPDDVDTIVEKAVVAQAEGDLSRAAALLAPLQLQANDPNALETQVYQTILERRPAPFIPRLEELLAKPDPALGYTNGELRFWLAWAQDVSGDHATASETWRTARQELESFLKEHPEDYLLLGDLALTDAALGDKAAAFAMADQAIAALPIEKDAVSGPKPIEVLARVAAQLGETDRAMAALRKLLTVPYSGVLGPGAPLTPALLRLDPMFDRLRTEPGFEKLVTEAEQALARDLAERTVSAKSIAVLPFENLSRDPDNVYFAEGIQNEIMVRLSKIADLKVISRTSTQHYQSAPGNLPEIARQLGVANILEGSVQKNGDAVRVNVQLIRADNDSNLWSETLDRKVTDIFSVESEVAKAIADQLRAKLTGQEEQVLAAKSTDNPQAYDAYLRGLAYSLKPANTTANILAAQKHLRESVRLDARFALAWALLSSVDSIGYLTKIVEPTVALREEARQAAETALTLNPNLGEAVLAKGYYHYGCLKDYDAAIRFYEQARQLLPNDSRISESLAYVTRRRGQWEKSETYFNEAERLDVRNANLFTQHALSYMRLRRLPEALRKLDQVLNITPDDVHIVAYKASIAQGQGDLAQAAKLLAPLHPTADDPGALETQVYQAILERRPASIIPRLQEILAKPDPELGYLNGDLRYWLGWAQDVAGDRAAAEKSWQQARTDLESFLKEQPQNANILSDLALTNMGLGDKAAALAFAERAIAANPLEKDAVSGPSPIETLARVTARVGEPDRAIVALQKLLSIPAVTDTVAPITPALLRLDPMFDPLRDDPRFQELCKDPPQ